MNNSKLTVGAFGDDVRELHARLTASGIGIPQNEVERGFFGPATRAALLKCQAERGVACTGEVDAATVAALSTPAAGLPTHPLAAIIPQSPAESSAPPLSSGGRKTMKPIANPPPPSLGPGAAPDAVGNLQDALLLLIEKERIRLPDDRRRELEEGLRRDRERHVYGNSTASVIIAVRQQFQLGSGEIVDEPTADMLNRLLRELGAFDAPEAEWVVRGQVVDAGGPVNDIAVSVYDRDLFFRRDGPMTGQHLGTDTTTDRDNGKTGWFELPYATSDFAPGDIFVNGSPIPDLIFALSRDGRALEKFQIFRLPDGSEIEEETPLSDDDLIMGLQARRVEEVRIVIEGGAPKPQLSEYEQLILALAPLLPEPAPEIADFARREALVGAMLLRFDEENHRDISFAARETRLERFLVEKLVAAFQLARDPFENIAPASVFYGLARAGIGSGMLSLARASTEDLRLALKKASTDTPLIIAPFSPESRLEESVQAIRDRLARTLPNYRAAEGTPSLADLVGADLPDAAEQATLWRTFSDHVGTAGEFWKKLATLPGFGDPQKVGRIKYSFQLGTLTQNNIALISAIRAKHPKLSSTGDLAFELDTKEKWSALLDDPDLAIPIPEDVPGKPAERKANYAASLASAVQIAHPTAAVANLVAALPPTEFSNAQPAVARFLSDAVRKTQFDLVEGRINDLLAEHGDDLLKDIQAGERPMVIAQVKRLQRLFRLSTGPQSVKALVAAGFNSAREIAELPPEVALDILTPLMGEAEARIVINRANNISAAAIHQYVLLNDVINNNIPGGAL